LIGIKALHFPALVTETEENCALRQFDRVAVLDKLWRRCKKTSGAKPVMSLGRQRRGISSKRKLSTPTLSGGRGLHVVRKRDGMNCAIDDR
jgi:hypothetical protein